MRLGLISDTHGHLPHSALALLAGVEEILHAGDVCDQAVLDALAAVAPVHAVAGNCDDDATEALPRTLVRSHGRHVIFVTHILGHGREHRPTAVVLAEIHRVGATIVVFGHTHRQACWLAGGITYVNPGSVSEGRGGPRSLAILELASDRIDIRFFGLDGRELEVLPGA